MGKNKINIAIIFILFFCMFPFRRAYADASTTYPSISITELFDGTAPFDSSAGSGNDTSGNNNIVRAGQLTSYKFDLSINDPAALTPTPYTNINFVTTPLPLGYVWDSLNVFCSGTGSGITGNGVTTQSILTCNSGTHNTGAAWSITENVRALYTLVDGSTFSFTATTSATGITTTGTAVTTPVTGTSTPKIDLQKGGAAWRTTTIRNGVAGGIYSYGLGIKLKPGSELPALPITFTDDINSVAPGAELVSCSLNYGPIDAITPANANNAVATSPKLPAGKIGVYGGNTAGFSTPARSVYDSGNITCIPRAGNPTTIDISITGVNTNPPSYPSSNWNGGALAVGDNWIVADAVNIWVPYSDFTPANLLSVTALNKFNNFNPLGQTTGRPNYSGGAEPGAGLSNIDTATNTLLTGTEDWYQQNLVRPGPGTIDKSDFIYKDTSINSTSVFYGPTGSLYGSGIWNSSIGTSYKSGDGVMASGGSYTSLTSMTFNGVVDIPTGFILCTTIDNNLVSVSPLNGQPTKAGIIYTGQPDTLVKFTDVRLEYGTGENNGIGSTWASNNNQKAGTCSDNDSTSGIWYSDISSVPGGASKITKVRTKFYSDFTATEQTAYINGGGGQLIYTGVHLSVLSGAALGAKVANYAKLQDPSLNWSSTWTNNPLGIYSSSYDVNTGLGTLGDRITIVGTRVRITKNIKNLASTIESTQSGNQNTWFLTSTADSMGIVPAGQALNVQVNDTIPAGLSYDLGSSFCADPLPALQPVNCTPAITFNSDGTTLLRWDFGNITSAQPITRLSYTTTSDSTIANGESRVNTAVISADNDNSLVQWRTSTATTQFLNPSSFSVNKKAVHKLVEPGDIIDYQLEYKNTGSLPIGPVDLIDWLPFVGDGRSPATNYNGSYSLNSIVQTSGVLATSILYTNTNSSTINLTTDFDPATINPSIIWCTQANFGSAGCPSSLSTVTGFRILAPNLNALQNGVFTIKIVPNLSSVDKVGDLFTNKFTARVQGLSLPMQSNNVTAAVVLGKIGDYVWNDINKDGKQDASEPGIANVDVNLLDSTGTIINSTTTDSNGKYSFTNIYHGSYQLEFIPPVGYSLTYQNIGLVNSDSNPDIITGKTPLFTMSVGEVNTSIDAGMVGSNPELKIIKKINGDDANIAPGVLVPLNSSMNVTYDVTNSGNMTLSSIAISDDKVLAADISCPKTTLFPLETMQCTAVISSPTVISQHTNTATVTGKSTPLPNGTTLADVTATDVANAYVQAVPGITIVKKINGQVTGNAPGISVISGSTMNFTFDITNTGNIQLANVTLSDNTIPTQNITCPKTVLDSLETMQCTATLPAPASGVQHTNTATVVGTPIPSPSNLNPAKVSAKDTANAFTSVEPVVVTTATPTTVAKSNQLLNTGFNYRLGLMLSIAILICLRLIHVRRIKRI